MTQSVFADGNPEAGLMFVGEGPARRTARPAVRRPVRAGCSTACWPASGSTGPVRDHQPDPVAPAGQSQPDRCRGADLPAVPAAPHRPGAAAAPGAAGGAGRTGGARRQRRHHPAARQWIEASIPGLPAPVAALPMLHPAYLLRTPGAKRDAWADLLLLRRTLDET